MLESTAETRIDWPATGDDPEAKTFPLTSVTLICGAVPLSVDDAFSLQLSAVVAGGGPGGRGAGLRAGGGFGAANTRGWWCWLPPPPARGGVAPSRAGPAHRGRDPP